MSTPVGPYTPIVRAGDWLIVSGQIGLGAGGLASGFGPQLTQALDNLRGLIEGEGATLAQVAKTTVFLVHMDDYVDLNDIYTAYFDAHGDGHRPARSAVAVSKLPIGALVEIEAWAHIA